MIHFEGAPAMRRLLSSGDRLSLHCASDDVFHSFGDRRRADDPDPNPNLNPSDKPTLTLAVKLTLTQVYAAVLLALTFRKHQPAQRCCKVHSGCNHNCRCCAASMSTLAWSVCTRHGLELDADACSKGQYAAVSNAGCVAPLS